MIPDIYSRESLQPYPVLITQQMEDWCVFCGWKACATAGPGVLILSCAGVHETCCGVCFRPNGVTLYTPGNNLCLHSCLHKGSSTLACVWLTLFELCTFWVPGSAQCQGTQGQNTALPWWAHCMGRCVLMFPAHEEERESRQRRLWASMMTLPSPH